MKKLLVVLILSLFIQTSSSLSLSYSDNGNLVTIIPTVDTISSTIYIEDADETTLPLNCTDGDWDTSGELIDDIYYFNYTIPRYTIGMIFKIRDFNGWRNISLPEELLPFQSLRLFFVYEGDGDYYVYANISTNTSDLWVFICYIFDPYLYEESILFYRSIQENATETQLTGNASDGDWETKTTTDISALINYAIPTGATGAIWKVKDSEMHFFTIPDDVFNYNSSTLYLHMYRGEGLEGYYYHGKNSDEIYGSLLYEHVLGGSDFYEEAIIFIFDYLPPTYLYRWNTTTTDGVFTGSTGWINGTTITNHHYTFTDTSSLVINLSVYVNSTMYYEEIIIPSSYKPSKVYETENTSYQQTGTTYSIDDEEIPWVPWVYEKEISSFPIFTLMLMISISAVLLIYINSKRPQKIKIGDYVVYYNKRRKT